MGYNMLTPFYPFFFFFVVVNLFLMMDYCHVKFKRQVWAVGGELFSSSSARLCSSLALLYNSKIASDKIKRRRCRLYKTDGKTAQ